MQLFGFVLFSFHVQVLQCKKGLWNLRLKHKHIHMHMLWQLGTMSVTRTLMEACDTYGCETGINSSASHNWWGWEEKCTYRSPQTLPSLCSAHCLSMCDDGALLQATLLSCSIPHFALSTHPLTVITACPNATGSLGEKIKPCVIGFLCFLIRKARVMLIVRTASD